MEVIQIQMQKLDVVKTILKSGQYRRETLIQLVKEVYETMKATEFIYSFPFTHDAHKEHAISYYSRGTKYKNLILSTLDDLHMSLVSKDAVAYSVALINSLLATEFHTLKMISFINGWKPDKTREPIQYMDLIV